MIFILFILWVVDMWFVARVHKKAWRRVQQHKLRAETALFAA
jgi:hypothetical protein